jgi:hypothetical protein
MTALLQPLAISLASPISNAQSALSRETHKFRTRGLVGQPVISKVVGERPLCPTIVTFITALVSS